jgi:two-component sensor histidine kinase
LATIDLNEYITHLANALFRSYGAGTGRIALQIDVADVVFGVDTAIPCGLIINEIVSNSLKYAFPDGKEGKIKITLRLTDGDEIELTVSDNGISMPDDLDLSNTGSLGLKLVRVLTDQIEGKLEVDRSEGTTFRIRFKRIKYKERV